MSLTGGCLCGQVRYTISADPLFTGICHCTNCQKQSGAAFSVNVGVKAEALSVTGDLKTYVDHGDSGKEVLRRFCPSCGSPIISDAAAYPGIRIIKAGTLDNASSLNPQFNVYWRDHQAWIEELGHLPKNDTIR